MNLLQETIALAEKAALVERDIKSLGLTWRWYQKVKSGRIPNPGVKHVLALNELAKQKLEQSGGVAEDAESQRGAKTCSGAAA